MRSETLGIVAVSVILTLLSLAGLGRAWNRRSARPGPPDSGVAFLFDDADLVDATPRGKSLVRRARPQQSDFSAVVTSLAHTFPDLAGRLADLRPSERRIIESVRSGTPPLEAERIGPLLRLALMEDDTSGRLPDISRHAMEQELESLRALGEEAPQLIWRQDRGGTVTWANRAYLVLADRLAAPDVDGPALWPPPLLFEVLTAGTGSETPVTQRLALSMPNTDAPQWFDVTSVWRGDETIHFAVEATPMVEAEMAQQSFVKTLAETFAVLSTGLAIFGRNRELMLFNPALVDLTGLQVQFLVDRPSVRGFFDRLREDRVLPEPKDYGAWRARIDAIRESAEAGTFAETWNLPDGRIFRVSGRPHPNSAIAFLFEDISAEVALTRNFREESDLHFGVLDHLDTALAVFSHAGTLVLSNAAYRELWHDGLDPATDCAAADEIDIWRQRARPCPLWGDIQDFMSQREARAGWNETIHLPDIGDVLTRVHPGPRGSTMVFFEPLRDGGARGLDRRQGPPRRASG